MPDAGSIPPAQRARPIVASVIVARHAGLATGVLDDLAAPRTMRALRDAAEDRRRAGELAAPLGDELYRIVPTLADRAARRAAIALRRDVHNGRWSEAVRSRVAVVGPLLAPDDAHRLARWAELARTAMRRHADAESSCAAETSAAAEAMRAHLLSARIAPGIALASPEFTNRLLVSPLDPAPSARSARSATAYLTRIAAKTSPFSSLTTVSISGFGGTAAPPCEQVPARAVSSARPVAVALLLACIQNGDAMGMLDVVAEGGLRRVDARLLANLPARFVTRGRPASVDEITDCGLAEWAVDLLPAKQVSVAELASTLAAAGPARVRRLLETGLLRPVLPWAASSVEDFIELAEWARERVPAELEAFAAALNRLVAAQRVVATELSAPRRTGALSAARTAVREAFDALGTPAPAWVSELPLFHEVDARPAAAGQGLPEPARQDLAEIARWLVPMTWRDPGYDELVRGYVHRYGRGAAGVGLLDFLYTFLNRADLTALATRPAAVDREAARDPARLRGHGTVAHAAHAVFFQIAAGNADQIAAGGHQTVVNAVHSGGLGLLGRWSMVPSVHERLADPLAAWARELHPGCTVYQVVPAVDWVDLQRSTLRSLPRVRLPGELPDAGESVDLTRMTVAHQPGTETLQVHGPDGVQAAFGYAGGVPQHLLTGLARLLCLLSNPWITMGRIDRDRHVRDDGGGAAFWPRLQRGRIVWARARWSFPVDELPSPERDGSAVGFLADVERWRQRHGLPDEVFATRISRHAGTVRKEKPQWLGFDHPHAIWTALAHPLADVSTIDFAEALPDRCQHWCTGEGGGRFAAEFVGLVRHG